MIPRPATHAEFVDLAGALVVAAAPAGPRSNRLDTTASPAREDRPRCAHFSFCGRECDVGYSRVGTDVEYADDIFVGAGFIATNDHGLLRIQLHEILEQIGQFGRSQRPPIDDHVSIRLYVNDHVPDRRAFFLRGRRLGNFNVELVFISGRVPGQKKKDQKQQQDVDQRGQLDPGVVKRCVATQIHEAGYRVSRIS